MNNRPTIGLFVKVFRCFRSKIDFVVSTHEAMMNELTNEPVKPTPRRVGFERAQDARRAMRQSPIARHREKLKEALRIIHGHGQSTSQIVADSCRSSSTRFIGSLKEAGLIRFERVLGQTFVLLTKTGLDMLRSMSSPSDVLANLQGTRSVNLYAFGHSMTAQRILAAKLKKGGEGCSWWCERQLRAELNLSESGAKVPDAAFRDASGHTVFIEVERSRKKQPQLEAMLLNLARLIENKSRASVEIHIEEGIVERYRSTLGSWLARKEFRAWSEDTTGELFQQGIYRLTTTLEAAMRRINFIITKIKP